MFGLKFPAAEEHQNVSFFFSMAISAVQLEVGRVGLSIPVHQPQEPAIHFPALSTYISGEISVSNLPVSPQTFSIKNK